MGSDDFVVVFQLPDFQHAEPIDLLLEPEQVVFCIGLQADADAERASGQQSLAQDARSAAARAEAIFGEEHDVVGTLKGSEIVGWRYRRPLDFVAEPAPPPIP